MPEQVFDFGAAELDEIGAVFAGAGVVDGEEIEVGWRVGVVDFDGEGEVVVGGPGSEAV